MKIDSNVIKELKHRQRQMLIQILSQLSEEEMAEQSLKASEAVIRSCAFEHANSVMAYMAMHREANPELIIQEALRLGKIVSVPWVDWNNWRIEPVRLRSIEEGLGKDRYGILTPIKLEYEDISEIELVITPGLGFSNDGKRLGRGGGFYDRFFSQPKLKAEKWGFAFSQQILPDIAAEESDIQVDKVVTAASFI